jgi:serine/threonine-protein kinase HipA
MLILNGDRRSQVASCIAASHIFLLTREDAIGIVNHQVDVIKREWNALCDEASLSLVDRNTFWRRQFLNSFAFYGAPDEVRIPGG